MQIDYTEYHEALEISEKGKIVVLKRELDEIHVNNYNKCFLLAWKANMDIQFCMDTYAVVTYITDYLSKGDVGLTKVLSKAVKETKGWNQFDTFNYLKKVFFTHY